MKAWPETICGSLFHISILLVIFGPVLRAQTTHGLIFGRITDDVDRQPLHAGVFATQTASGSRFDATTDNSGVFVIPLLPPGDYTLVAELDGYRPAQIEHIDVPVGGFVEQNVSLRLLTDLWQRQFARRSFSPDNLSVLLFYGPDVDTSRSEYIDAANTIHGDVAPSLSYVVDTSLIENLPLSGRDVYQLITLQPGVTSDLATLRGVGVSVNGQRPSSGSFLLDGLDNNNYLITGPYSALPPEAISEYRISTNNFSAEYGGTSGYLANAVTRAGGNQWHGLGYGYLINEALDADDPGRKEAQEKRLPLRDYEPGFRIGGPLLRDRLFEFGFIDYGRQQSWNDAVNFNVPTSGMIAALPPGSLAASLFRMFPAPSAGSTGQVQLRPPVVSDRVTALNSLDWVHAQDRIFGRLMIQRMWEPDFIWSPYPAFDSALNQNAASASVVDTHAWTPSITSELRAGLGRDLLGWNQAHPEIPQLDLGNLTLPGSPARYVFNNHGTQGEVSGNLLLNGRRQFFKAGAGLLMRATSSSYVPPGAAEAFGFSSWDQFAANEPGRVTFAAARDAATANNYSPAQIARDYRYGQTFFFAEDSIRVTDRLLVHIGVRYDYFGAPLNVGPAEGLVDSAGHGNQSSAKTGGSVAAAAWIGHPAALCR